MCRCVTGFLPTQELAVTWDLGDFLLEDELIKDASISLTLIWLDRSFVGDPKVVFVGMISIPI